eukprot:gene16511-10974_t
MRGAVRHAGVPARDASARGARWRDGGPAAYSIDELRKVRRRGGGGAAPRRTPVPTAQC